VCGFVAPPDKFQDPDVDLHKQLDLRNNSDLDGGDVADLNADTNDRDGDGLDDHTGEPIEAEDEAGADDAQPMLTCPNCGFEAEGGEPTSVDTTDAVPGQEGTDAPADGPAAGDLCPNCGKAPLMSPAELAEATGAPQEDDPDPDAAPDAAPEEDDPEMEDRGSPFPSKDDSGDSDDADDADGKDEDDSSDSDEDNDDQDQHSDDSWPPARKKAPPAKS
jgi:hypothetical protein